MLLVLVLGVDPLDIHLADVGLISVAKFVHAANQIVPLVSQVLQLVVKGHFMLAIFDFIASEVFKLDIEVPDSTSGGLMVTF